MTLSGSTNSAKKSDEINLILSEELRKSDIYGGVLLAQEIESSSQPQDLPGGPTSILLVNSTYLKAYPELKSTVGETPSTDNRINIYIPENRRPYEEAIDKGVKAYLELQAGEGSGNLAQISTHVITSAAWPLINDIYGLNTKTSIKDPVVVLLSDGLTPVSNVDLAAAITKSQLVFTSRAAAEKVVSDGKLTTYVHSLVSSDQARIEARDKAAQDLAQQTVTFILGIIILIISSTALAALWVQSRRQRLFAEWVTGHSWLRRHSIAVFGYTLLTIATVTAWSIFITPSTSESLPPGEDDRLALLGWAGTLGCAIAITVFITSLAITTARTDHRQEGHA
ncbi:Uncharacterized protein conserved in bacteria [Dermatophilus congolensis]|uniref:Uncharacterized protein conserved in bacteria n=2 Tax=Dermatophilus congolensis TaxID=1863 RepID=A0A239VDG2_9MICO|nr:Uncharacterized protein conserved in bacteria [Dermatophilus congolensis]